MSTKRKIIMPTEDEDAAITAAALSDPDAQPLTDAELAQFKPARRRGRPTKASPKVPVNLRLDAEVVEAFKAAGNGWQTRINTALLEHLAAERDAEERKKTLRQAQEQLAARISALSEPDIVGAGAEHARKTAEALAAVLADAMQLISIAASDNSYALAA